MNINLCMTSKLPIIKNKLELGQVFNTGWVRLIRTRLMQSSTLFEVSMKWFLFISYHFMLKMHG